MAPHNRRQVGASRREKSVDEEGEEGGSLNAELEQDTSSEGSEISHEDDNDDDADGEISDGSEDDVSEPSEMDGTSGRRINGRMDQTTGKRPERKPPSAVKEQLKMTVSDTEAMLNGMKISEEHEQVAEVHFDDFNVKLDRPVKRTPSAPPMDQRQDNFAERRRRGRERYFRERDGTSASVPSKGSFFLHDKRLTEPARSNDNGPFNKPKSKPHGLIVDSNVRRNPSKSVASEGPWTHDLHETLASDDNSNSSAPRPLATPSASVTSNPPKPLATAPRSFPPNRSFSSTTLIGNVPVVVFLPGMNHPVSHATIPKRRHTRLPQHRPPLRRDKPVRISIPSHPPRYILPSTERSFIFIPRALRPNQQSFRGRGRGGFFSGRHPNIYTHAGHSPNLTVNRRPSIGRVPREGFNQPIGPVYPRQTMVSAESCKPMVQLPPVKPAGNMAGPPAAGQAPTQPRIPPPIPLLPQPQNPVYRESQLAPIPMHQPRPQKAVSVADIESPANFPVNPPQPQQEQPFHQQVPMPSGPTYAPDSCLLSQSSYTPVSQLSHIPERAIHAQPFQPCGFQQPQGFYPVTYPSGAMFYPVSGMEYSPYIAANCPTPSVPTFQSAQQIPYMMPPPPTSVEQPSRPGTVAHEAGGTVYYYDTSQVPVSGQFAYPPPMPNSETRAVGMMTSQTPTYYYP